MGYLEVASRHKGFLEVASHLSSQNFSRFDQILEKMLFGQIFDHFFVIFPDFEQNVGKKSCSDKVFDLPPHLFVLVTISESLFLKAARRKRPKGSNYAWRSQTPIEVSPV